jgi:hypothetical protein
MRQVSRFESILLKILHVVVASAPAAQVLKLLVRRAARPRCLSRDCVELVQDTLAKGCTYWLATGGWRNEPFLRNDAARGGRLWERTPPSQLGLEFSGFALDFLIWLTEADTSKDEVWQPFEEKSLTLGDRFVLTLAFDAVADTEIGPHWAAHAPFRNDGLCALLRPELMTAGPRSFSPNFEPWMSPLGQSILESVQRRLAQRWVRVEASKATIVSGDQMLSLGKSQQTTINAYLQAIDNAGRRDLARWLLIAFQSIVADSPEESRWMGGLDVKGLRVAQRMELYRTAVAFLATTNQLSKWQKQAEATGYFDEDYAASQIWKTDWEQYNSGAVVAAAQRLVKKVEPLGA